ncbi:MFS transporter [Streptomyces sp. CA-111067]|uniref:MFS transporter n=1 Tax=Streptomyces sp. CA-111067 TaxID=3240046 RepID=UPI003D991730
MPPHTPHRRRLILATCCLSVLIVSLDNTALNVALPALRSDFRTGVSGLQWTVDAYTLVLATFLMFFGSLADRIGRRRVFRTGLAVFVAASLLCSLAPTLDWLIAARTLQAVGGAMLNPVAMSIITGTFTDPRGRARALGVWSAVLGVSMCAGPVIGGLAVEVAGWRAIFWINVPVGLAALTLTALFVPESRAPRPRRVDPVGQALVMLLLAALTFGIIESPDLGWSDPLIAGSLALSAGALAGLLCYEPRRVEPLIDLRFFRSAAFSGATVIAVAAFAALNGFLFLNSLYLQETRGFSPLAAGLATLPLAAMTLLTAPLSGRLTGNRGARLPLVAAGLSFMAGGVLLALVAGRTTPLPLLLAGYGAFGAGVGFVNTPISDTAVAGMPRAQAGVAAAVASTSRHVGSCLGVAVAGALAGSAGGGSGTGSAWWTTAGCGAAVLLIGLVTTGRWARRTATRSAERYREHEPAPGPAARAGN